MFFYLSPLNISVGWAPDNICKSGSALPQPCSPPFQYLMERVHSLLDPTTPQIVVSSCLEESYKRFLSTLTFAHPDPADHKIVEELSDHPEIT